jgi:hypothetical protein
MHHHGGVVPLPEVLLLRQGPQSEVVLSVQALLDVQVPLKWFKGGVRGTMNTVEPKKKSKIQNPKHLSLGKHVNKHKKIPLFDLNSFQEALFELVDGRERELWVHLCELDVPARVVLPHLPHKFRVLRQLEKKESIMPKRKQETSATMKLIKKCQFDTSSTVNNWEDSAMSGKHHLVAQEKTAEQDRPPSFAGERHIPFLHQPLHINEAHDAALG